MKICRANPGARSFEDAAELLEELASITCCKERVRQVCQNEGAAVLEARQGDAGRGVPALALA